MLLEIIEEQDSSNDTIEEINEISNDNADLEDFLPMSDKQS